MRLLAVFQTDEHIFAKREMDRLAAGYFGKFKVAYTHICSSLLSYKSMSSLCALDLTIVSQEHFQMLC